jgi:hypothetical protein
VCVLMCRFRSDGRSNDLPHTSQGNSTRSLLFIVDNILESRESPINDSPDEKDSSDVDSYSPTTQYELCQTNDPDLLEFSESNVIDKSNGESVT